MSFLNAEIPKPKILSDWTTVGSNAVSLIWRTCGSNQSAVSRFLIGYRQLCDITSYQHYSKLLSVCNSVSQVESILLSQQFLCFNIRREFSSSKRSNFVARNLHPSTEYLVLIVSCCDLSVSKPCVVFIRTTPVFPPGAGHISTQYQPCDGATHYVHLILRTAVKFLCFLYLTLSLYTLFLSYKKLHADLCFIAYSFNISHCSIQEPVLPEIQLESTSFYNISVNWFLHFITRTYQYFWTVTSSPSSVTSSYPV